jgi:hypothetical protein
MTDDVFDIVLLQAEAAKRGALAIWTVYERPRDYPCGFIARRFEVSGLGPKPTRQVIKCLELEPIRDKLERAGLVCMARQEGDEPQIVESWV